MDDLSIMQIEEALRDFPERYCKAREARRKAEIPYRNIDELKKSMFAKIQFDVEKRFEEKLSEAKLERLALAEPGWIKFLSSYNKARALFLSTDSHVKYLEAELDCLRSRNAMHKREMNSI